MLEEQKYLPNEILQRSIVSGKEYGWKRRDFEEVVEEAVKVGLGIMGGQVQIKLPDGTCELYWRNYDTHERVTDEDWVSYCDRTRQECFSKFEMLPANQTLIEEGIENFKLLKEKSEQGVNLEEYLIFILYFDGSETEKLKGKDNTPQQL